MKQICLFIMPMLILLWSNTVISQEPSNNTGGDLAHQFEAGWQLIPSGVDENLYAVHFANSTHGFIGGALTRCIKSNDGGLHWDAVYVPTLADFQAVWMTSANNVCLGAWDSVYLSQNGGSSWTGAYTNTVNYTINDLQFLSEDKGFAFLAWTTFSKTDDGGYHWSEPTGGFTAWDFFAGYMVDENTGWGVGDCGVIAKTTDGGDNWVSYEWNNWQDFSCIPIWGIYATSVLNAWAVADSGLVFRTIDGGNTWSRNTLAGPDDRLTDIYFVNDNLGYIVGYNGLVFKSTDGGESWFQEPQVTSNNLNAVFFLTDKLGWAVGDNGTILRFEGTNGILRDDSPSEPKGMKICPNPLSGESTLSFILPQKQNVKIDICDLSGRILFNVHEGSLESGDHSVNLNLPALLSGAYFCRICTTGYCSTEPFIISR